MVDEVDMIILPTNAGLYIALGVVAVLGALAAFSEWIDRWPGD